MTRGGCLARWTMDGSESEQAAGCCLGVGAWELRRRRLAGWLVQVQVQVQRAGAGAGLVELLVRHSVRVGGDLGQPQPREQRLHK